MDADFVDLATFGEGFNQGMTLGSNFFLGRRMDPVLSAGTPTAAPMIAKRRSRPTAHRGRRRRCTGRRRYGFGRAQLSQGIRSSD